MFSKTLISDYMFIKDRLFAALTLNEKEMSLYDSVARILEQNIIMPDLVIYLQADTDKLMDQYRTHAKNLEVTMAMLQERIEKLEEKEEEEKRMWLEKLPQREYMPLTRQESVGLGVGVLNIWSDYVDAHSMRQLDLVINQYVDDRIVAYVRNENDDLGIRVVKIDEIRNLRAKKILTL